MTTSAPPPALRGPSNRSTAGSSPPILVLKQVHARDAAGPRGRARGGITDLSLALGQGIHAIVGTPEDGTLALFDVLTGSRPPLRGRVAIDGRDPAATPAVRARLGALAAEPRLPPAPSVGASVRLALRARGEVGHRFDAVLDPLGLSALHARQVRSLSFAEARAVELALALTTPAPLVIALHEPLGDVALPNLHLVQRRLREIAAARACVVVTTSSPADALALADRVLVLHKGFLVRETGGDGRGLGHGGFAELTAWIAASAVPGEDRSAVGREAARTLVAALSRAPGVRGVGWEEARHGASLVRVRAETAEACADALIEATVATGVAIEAISPLTPALSEVRATTDALLRGGRSSFLPRPTPLPIPPHMPPHSSPKDAQRATSSLPAPPPRGPVEHGGPLGRPKSVPAPRSEDDLRAIPILPAPPALPNIPGARLSSSAEEPSDPTAHPISTADKDDR